MACLIMYSIIYSYPGGLEVEKSSSILFTTLPLDEIAKLEALNGGALFEGEVTRAEKRTIQRHVARCRDCRRKLEEERALTRMLRRTRRRGRALPILGFAASLLIGLLLFWPRPAHGSIEQRPQLQVGRPSDMCFHVSPASSLR